LYELNLPNTAQQEITEEAVVDILARIHKGLSGIDQAKFKASFDAWDTNTTNQTNANTALTMIIAEGKLIAGMKSSKFHNFASTYTKDDNTAYTNNDNKAIINNF